MSSKPTVFLIVYNLIILTTALILVWLLQTNFTTSINSYEELYLSRRKLSVAEMWRESLKSTELARTKLSSIFVNSDSLVRFIEQIERLAQTHNISLSLSEPTSKEKSLELKLDLKGDFNNLQIFFSQLEDMAYDLRLEEVSLQSADGAWSAQANLLLESFDGGQ